MSTSFGKYLPAAPKKGERRSTLIFCEAGEAVYKRRGKFFYALLKGFRYRKTRRGIAGDGYILSKGPDPLRVRGGKK